MVRKKQFINKKTAQHFHVVHRSQRDPKANDPEASKYVLISANKPEEIASDSEHEDDFSDESDDDMPDLIDSPNSKPRATQSLPPTATMHKGKPKAPLRTRKVRFGEIVAEDMVDEMGMVRDGYDYSQHLKEMGKGRFYSAHGEFASASDLARRVDLPEDVLPSTEEQDRLLDAITLTTETMDEDLREALVNDEAFEELDDDFVVQAAQDEEVVGGADGFDYDAHIAKLMAAASGEYVKFKGDLTDDEDEDEFDEDDEEFSDDEEDDEEEMTPVDRSEEQRALDEAFEKMLAEEYDDDQLGELEDDDPETRGEVVLEGALLDVIVEDYVQVKQELLNDEGKLGNPLRTGNRLKEIIEECAREREEDGETDEEEDPVDAEAHALEVERDLVALMERSTYLQARPKEQWDVETIVSTYSNLDNHPTILREDTSLLKKKKKKKPAAAALDEEALAAAARNKSQILLSKKTGMPLGVFVTEPTTKKAEKPPKEETLVTLAPKKKSEETKEEKKARKEAVKAQKQQRRQEKKQWKTAFKEEEQRQIGQTQPGKVSVFKY